MDRLGRVALQSLAESVVEADEVPGRTAHFGDRPADRVSERPGVESPLDGGRLAELSGQVGRRGRRRKHRAILLMHEGIDGEADAGIGEVDDRVDALFIHPTPRNRDADVGLVLMIGENDLHLEAARLLGEVLGRELSADEAIPCRPDRRTDRRSRSTRRS